MCENTETSPVRVLHPSEIDAEVRALRFSLYKSVGQSYNSSSGYGLPERNYIVEGTTVRVFNPDYRQPIEDALQKWAPVLDLEYTVEVAYGAPDVENADRRREAWSMSGKQPPAGVFPGGPPQLSRDGYR